MIEPREIIFLDFETTNLLAPEAAKLSKQPYICELYMCKITNDYQIIDYLESFVRPPIPMPIEASNVNNIYDEMLKDAPTFIEIYSELCDFFLGVKGFCSHNLSFDSTVLRHELSRHELQYKFPWPKNYICTIEKSLGITGKRMSLAKLYYLATGKQIEGAHRARADVIPLIQCFKYLSDKGCI